jgi:hypothetical protein
MEHIGLHSVGIYHKKFDLEKEKNKNILCQVFNNGTRQSIFCRVLDVGHSTKNLLCRVSKAGARQS